MKNNDDENTTTDRKVRFYGNVTVGGNQSSSNNNNYNNNETEAASTEDVTLDELRELYDVVVLAYGCESDKELDLPVDVLSGEESLVVDDHHHPEAKVSDVRGILSAREFVNWYNGHPDYGWVTEEVRASLWKTPTPTTTTTTNEAAATKGEQVSPSTAQNIVVIGHGNVALDCARILAKDRGVLDPTDLTTRAIDVLRPASTTTTTTAASATTTTTKNDPTPSWNGKRSITVIGRRGHPQAAFTIKEVRELTKLRETTSGGGSGAQLIVRRDELELGETTEASKEELSARPKARIHKLLHQHASPESPDSTDSDTEVRLRFLTNPVRFRARADKESPTTPEQQQQQRRRRREGGLELVSVVCERMELVGDTAGGQSSRGTGVTEILEADLCLVSIGYRGLPIDASTTASYDTQGGVLLHDRGRVRCREDTRPPATAAPLYVSGWLKRGPSGIIGTNIGDARETVHSILEDLRSGSIPKRSSPKNKTLRDLLEERKIEYVDWEAYKRLEAFESSPERLRHPEQPREKVVDREELLKAAAGAAVK